MSRETVGKDNRSLERERERETVCQHFPGRIVNLYSLLKVLSLYRQPAHRSRKHELAVGGKSCGNLERAIGTI